MALESLSNALQSLSAQPYTMNLRSADALTNDPTWSATTQYFINDMVQSPTDGGMYVYTAWNPFVPANTSSCIVSVNDPASSNGASEGWAPTQSNGLKSVKQQSAAVTGVAAGAAGALGGTAGLGLTFAGAGGLGQESTWLVKLDYTATLTGAAAFAATEWTAWSVTANGTGPTGRTCNHVFGAGAVASGSPVSMIVTAPADATAFTVAGVQSATSVVLLPGQVTATFARLF